MKTVATILASLTLTAFALYTLYPTASTGSSKLLGASKGYLYDVKVCGSNNYNLDLVSFTNDEAVKSRANVHMHLNFKGQQDGHMGSLLLKVSKVIPLFSQTYPADLDYKTGEEASFEMVLSMPTIPIHATVDVQVTVQDSAKKDLLTVCAKLDI